MAKYCKNCGSEMDEGSVFCDNCGTKVGESKPNVQYGGSQNPFSQYKIDMIDGESVIRNSEVHPACLIAPGIILAIGVFIWLLYAFSTLYYLGPYGFITGFFNPFLIFGIIWMIIRLNAYLNTDLILTNRRVFGKCGLISTTQMQSPLNMINSVSFSNGILGKLLGYGSVEIASASTKFKFRFIKDGQSLYSDIFRQVESAQNELIEKQAKAIAKAIKNS